MYTSALDESMFHNMDRGKKEEGGSEKNISRYTEENVKYTEGSASTMMIYLFLHNDNSSVKSPQSINYSYNFDCKCKSYL